MKSRSLFLRTFPPPQANNDVLPQVSACTVTLGEIKKKLRDGWKNRVLRKYSATTRGLQLLQWFKQKATRFFKKKISCMSCTYFSTGWSTFINWQGYNSKEENKHWFYISIKQSEKKLVVWKFEVLKQNHVTVVYLHLNIFSSWKYFLIQTLLRHYKTWENLKQEKTRSWYHYKT